MRTLHRVDSPRLRLFPSVDTASSEGNSREFRSCRRLLVGPALNAFPKWTTDFLLLLTHIVLPRKIGGDKINRRSREPQIFLALEDEPLPSDSVILNLSKSLP